MLIVTPANFNKLGEITVSLHLLDIWRDSDDILDIKTREVALHMWKYDKNAMWIRFRRNF